MESETLRENFFGFIDSALKHSKDTYIYFIIILTFFVSLHDPFDHECPFSLWYTQVDLLLLIHVWALIASGKRTDPFSSSLNELLSNWAPESKSRQVIISCWKYPPVQLQLIAPNDAIITSRVSPHSALLSLDTPSCFAVTFTLFQCCQHDSG